MKRYTQEEFDALPVIDDWKQCPTGDYSAISSFGGWCSFGECCRFGECCIFGECCRFGERCRFGKRGRFGKWCSFGKWCRFGECCIFGEACRLGEECRFGERCSFEGHEALPGYPIQTYGGGGSVNRTIYAFNVEGGPVIRAECFVGDLDKFRAKVRADGDKLKSLQYLGFANIVAATWCQERIEK